MEPIWEIRAEVLAGKPKDMDQRRADTSDDQPVANETGAAGPGGVRRLPSRRWIRYVAAAIVVGFAVLACAAWWLALEPDSHPARKQVMWDGLPGPSGRAGSPFHL